MTFELRISDLSKTYPNGVRALDHVSLTIPTGMFGLVGPNGAGKSTLMRTLATLQEPDQGSVTLGDIDVLGQKEEVRKMLGYLPQEFGVYPKITGESMLHHFAILKGIAPGDTDSVVEELLVQTNLWDARKRKLGTYSGGMKQRFGIAQALLGDPKLIIVDEPTAGLDPAERLRFLNLLSEIGEDTVVILSTHIVEDIAVFGEEEGGPATGKLLKMEKRRITESEQSFELIVDTKPVRAGVDPFHKLIDRNPDDNVKRVDEAAATVAGGSS